VQEKKMEIIQEGGERRWRGRESLGPAADKNYKSKIPRELGGGRKTQR